MANFQELYSGGGIGRNGKKALVSLVLAVCFCLSGQSLAPAKANTSVASLLPRPDIAPETGALFGSYIKPFTGAWNITDWKAAMAKREGDMGRTLDVNHHYMSWTTNLVDWQLEWDRSAGRYSMISWNGPTSMSAITSGSQDAMIRTQADSVAAFGDPVLIRWMWEMDTRSSQIATPEEFVAAWRRLHDLFDARGATNALWTWCPTAWAFSGPTAQRYYPGDAYVDWICSDGYNWAPGRPDAQWRGFKEIFGDFYTWGTAHNKPLMVGETGTEERNAGEKAGWYNGIVPAMKDYPAMKALIYFDTATTDLAGGWFEWRPDTSTSAYNAYIGMAQNPYLNQSLEVPPPPPPPVERTLSVAVDGPGSVSAGALDMTCAATCTKVVHDGTKVTLTATPSTGASFVGWDGVCAGTSTTCTFEVSADHSVVARFANTTLKKPKLTKPDRRLQDTSSISVAWTDENATDGITYELQTLSGSNRSSLNASTPLVQGVGGISSVMMNGDAGKTYCFSIRALGAGGVSDWSDEECTSVPLDDPALRRSGSWNQKSAATSYGGSYSTSRKRGSRLVSKDVKAKHLTVLAKGCRRCGKVKVLWNSKRLGRWDLSNGRGEREINVASFDSVKTGTVKIVVGSKNKRVRIDGLGLSQH